MGIPRYVHSGFELFMPTMARLYQQMDKELITVNCRRSLWRLLLLLVRLLPPKKARRRVFDNHKVFPFPRFLPSIARARPDETSPK